MADISQLLVNQSTQSAALAFEFQFSQIQNTIIRRLNNEIGKVNETGASQRHQVEALQREGRVLLNSGPALKEYLIGNNNNVGRLGTLFESTTTLFSSLGEDDTVTQAEADAFNAQRDAVIAELDNVYVFIHPDVNDGQVIQYLKQQKTTLEGLSAVAGSKTGDQANVDALAGALNFRDRVGDAQTVSQNTVSTTLDLTLDIEARAASIQAEITDLTTVDQARKTAEVEQLRANFSNVLSAISLSFEVNLEFAKAINSGLSVQRPAPGSVLNLFV